MGINPIASVSEMVKAVAGPLFNWLDDRKFTEQERSELSAIQARVEANLEKEFIVYEEQLADSRSKVLVAELQQSDKYTKRARPSIIYVGLFVIVFNYVLVQPIMALFGHPDFVPINLPALFWATWGGITGTYSIGRSLEKSRKAA